MDYKPLIIDYKELDKEAQAIRDKVNFIRGNMPNKEFVLWKGFEPRNLDAAELVKDIKKCLARVYVIQEKLDSLAGITSDPDIKEVF